MKLESMYYSDKIESDVIDRCSLVDENINDSDETKMLCNSVLQNPKEYLNISKRHSCSLSDYQLQRLIELKGCEQYKLKRKFLQISPNELESHYFWFTMH